MAKSSKKTTKQSSKKSIGVAPLGDRVLIQVPPREEKTVSGIIIPDTVNSESTDNKRGVIVAIGEGKYDDGILVPMRVKEGDKVLFQWGEVVKIDGEEYHLVSESNILAIIK